MRRKVDLGCLSPQSIQTLMGKPFMELRKFARRYGAEISIVNSDDIYERYSDLSEAPFSNDLALSYSARHVFVYSDYFGSTTQSSRFSAVVCGAVHELGHVLASRDKVHNCEEFEFFGWEWVLAKKINLEHAWLKSNSAYGLEDAREFGELGVEERDKMLREALHRAEELGLVVNGEPVSIREL